MFSLSLFGILWGDRLLQCLYVNLEQAQQTNMPPGIMPTISRSSYNLGNRAFPVCSLGETQKGSMDLLLWRSFTAVGVWGDPKWRLWDGMTWPISTIEAVTCHRKTAVLARGGQRKLAGNLVFNRMYCHWNYQRPTGQEEDRPMDLKTPSLSSGGR